MDVDVHCKVTIVIERIAIGIPVHLSMKCLSIALDIHSGDIHSGDIGVHIHIRRIRPCTAWN